jgi:asparagine synthase (glutamine-hydrolysing)
MCGIAGFLGEAAASHAESLAVVERMTSRVTHRGPDGAGAWVDASAGVALGHRRLSIVDLSPAGAQPMVSADGRWVVTYNGEIYNHREIANELSSGGPVAFRGHSDTEVLVEGIARWGVGRTVRKCIGMFALGVWDRQERRLHLVRDRLGIKPLYFGRFGGSLLFGSELAALKAHPAFRGEIDSAALAAYFRCCNVPAPLSIYRGVRKLEPGCILSFDGTAEAPTREQYWSAFDVAVEGRRNPFRGSYEEALDALGELLGDAVARRMVADVPLGAFLSGGIDSSLVVALMQERSARPVKTYTIGFADPAFDESRQAREVAAALGTDHTELVVAPRDAQAVIPELPRIYDEPFADSSMIPTFLVSRLARESVTVALSGDGGDELFGGYNRHVWAPRLWRVMRRAPWPVRVALARLLRTATPATWDVIAGRVMPLVPERLRFRLPGDKLHKVAGVLPARTPRGLYDVLATAGLPDVLGTKVSGSDPWREAPVPEGLSFAEEMMLLDLVTYLPDDILTKVDRASMAVALEARVPILDHRVVALAWSFPERYRIVNGVTKAPLRDLLARRLPRSLFERPKAGFGIPVGEWVRGPLRDWAEALVQPARVRAQGLLDDERVQALWRDHLAGRTNATPAVWAVLMFQAWMERESALP